MSIFPRSSLTDIAHKTKRGQKGRVKQGKVAGGNSYGYQVLHGVERGGRMEHGDRAIDPRQAEVVQRIYRDYAAGYSPRKIAEQLNDEGIPGPRGGTWGASTLHGNRERGTGILNNELYIGKLVWNRQTFARDPDTGKRQARLNKAEFLVITEVPHLRIIDPDLWEAVRRRQGALRSKGTDVPVWDRQRPRTLLSGLMTCGCCGSGFSKISKDAFGCSVARNKGASVCANRLTIKQAELEAAVLNSLARHLMDPDAVQVFCEEYAAERNRLAASAGANRKQIEGELAQIKRDHDKLVDAILRGIPAEAIKDRMLDLESRRKTLQAQLARAAP